MCIVCVWRAVEICCSFRRKQIGYIHQYLCLCVWLKHVQYIVAYYCVKFTVGEIGAIIVIISNNVVPLLMEFISIKTKPTAEVKYFPFQQFVLHEVSCRHRKVCPFDGSQIRMVYLLWLYVCQFLHSSNPAECSP